MAFSPVSTQIRTCLYLPLISFDLIATWPPQIFLFRISPKFCDTHARFSAGSYRSFLCSSPPYFTPSTCSMAASARCDSLTCGYHSSVRTVHWSHKNMTESLPVQFPPHCGGALISISFHKNGAVLLAFLQCKIREIDRPPGHTDFLNKDFLQYTCSGASMHSFTHTEHRCLQTIICHEKSPADWCLVAEFVAQEAKTLNTNPTFYFVTSRRRPEQELAVKQRKVQMNP